MLRASLFWGLMLIMLGALLGLQAAGIIAGSVWGYMWGVFLLGAGLWLTFAGLRNPREPRPGSGVSIDRRAVTRADLRFDFGAGTLVLRSGASADKILEGSSSVAMDLGVRYDDDEARIKFSAGASWLPFIGPDEGAWVFQLNPEIPLDIRVSCGASSVDFDMRDLQLKSIRFETGASKIKLLLPASAGETYVDIQGGASSFDLMVPQGVEARIDIREGASAITVDETRFPRAGHNRYESAGYEGAANRVEIILNTGAARIDIRQQMEVQ